jgi:hypothetical protein
MEVAMPRYANPHNQVKFLMRLPESVHAILKKKAAERMPPVSLHYEILERLVMSLRDEFEAKPKRRKAA